MASTSHITSVAVIGGHGFLGRRLVNAFAKLQPVPKISIISRQTRDHDEYPSSVTQYAGDITSKEEITRILNETKPQVIIHTVSPPPTIQDLPLYQRVNIEGTRNLLECASTVGSVEAFVYTSSASVIHDAFSELVMGDETYPLVFMPKQREKYSHTKAVADQMVLEANRRDGSQMLTVSLRPSAIFGEEDPWIIKGMIRTARLGFSRLQVGNGRNLFDFTYVDNVVHAHVLAARALVQTASNLKGGHSQDEQNMRRNDKIDGEAFFITNDEPVRFWDFGRDIGAAAGYQTPKEKVWVLPRSFALALGLVAEWVVYLLTLGVKAPSFRRLIRFSSATRTFNIEKAKVRLGYKPLVNMADAIKRTASAYRTDKTKLR